MVVGMEAFFFFVTHTAVAAVSTEPLSSTQSFALHCRQK